MFCKECGSEINDKAAVCVKCGVAVGPAGRRAVSGGGTDRTTYILLGLLLSIFGVPGIHNFYAGHTSKGVLQICLTVCSCWLLWPFILIWVIIEVCTVEVDGYGNPMN